MGKNQWTLSLLRNLKVRVTSRPGKTQVVREIVQEIEIEIEREKTQGIEGGQGADLMIGDVSSTGKGSRSTKRESKIQLFPMFLTRHGMTVSWRS
jgi:N-dimethylarginine dimethylaminohydrolase